MQWLVPGNWCTVIPKYPDSEDDGVYEGSQTGWETTIDGAKQLTRFMFFPDPPDVTCLGGGAGGDTITTRNGENNLVLPGIPRSGRGNALPGRRRPGQRPADLRHH